MQIVIETYMLLKLVLLPYMGYIRPFHRKSLTTMQEDLEDFTRRVINLETGHIYLKPKVIYDYTNYKYDSKGTRN